MQPVEHRSVGGRSIRISRNIEGTVTNMILDIVNITYKQSFLSLKPNYSCVGSAHSFFPSFFLACITLGFCVLPGWFTACPSA